MSVEILSDKRISLAKRYIPGGYIRLVLNVETKDFYVHRKIGGIERTRSFDTLHFAHHYYMSGEHQKG